MLSVFFEGLYYFSVNEKLLHFLVNITFYDLITCQLAFA